MTHLAIHEWGRVAVGGGQQSFTRAEANHLIAAAQAHRLGGDEGTYIVSDHHQYLRARQCVGVLASAGSSLEILPKIDPMAPDQETGSVRGQLVRMLDAALGLGLSEGEMSSLARQNSSLLDILIRIFADRLLAQARLGLPRAYRPIGGDMAVLRGRLDIVRQFTIHSVRPDRLACRFDELSVDTPLMQIMRSCVIFLHGHARQQETLRRLAELRMLMDSVREIRTDRLPWASVRIDRSNRRWRTLYDLAKLFLMRDWQATHHDASNSKDGISLLFPMNDLFEATVATALRRALSSSGMEVVTQGGSRYCLGEWTANGPCNGSSFRTRPDIIIRSAGRVVAIVDTKWKCLRDAPEERNRGIRQSDVYQLMAYAQLYSCNRLLLLYPHHAGLMKTGVQANYGIAVAGKSSPDRLQVATVDVGQTLTAMAETLRPILLDALGSNKTDVQRTRTTQSSNKIPT